MDIDTSSSSAKVPVVLIVDDDEDNRILIAQQLMEVHNFSLSSAADGQTAITLAQNHHFDLILLDIMLPDMDGIAVIQQLRQRCQNPNIPIVAVTALARREEQDKILAAGFDGYITKPYDLEELAQVVCQKLNLMCCLS